MHDDNVPGRRQFLRHAAMGIAALPFASMPAVAVQPRAKAPAGQPSFGPLRQIKAGLLDVEYVELGAANGPPVLLIHGWPYDIHTYADAAPILAAAGHRVIVPHLRGYGSTHFLSAETPRNGQQSVFATDMIALLDALAIKQAIVSGCDWGARTACILAALWPERVSGLASVSGYLIGSQRANSMPLPPKAELAWWYQFYFATERGRLGYAANRSDFARLIWQTASPKWDFDAATFAQSAAALDNPDHVAIVIDNYRWRLGLAAGERRLDALEAKLATAPAINVPTITLEGEANGAPHPEPSAYATKFAGRYAHRTLAGGIGHNLPQEAPKEFAQAVREVAQWQGK
jgi:pimeloyl-ACP methyl ester carboxylesterase